MPADVPGPVAGDVRDVVARMRAGALDTAATVYTATYGHPLEHPSPDAPTGPRRWQLSPRLAVVAAIVSAHGGRYGVESEFGCGSAFWIKLPAGPTGA